MRNQVLIRPDIVSQAQLEIAAELALYTPSGYSLIVGRTKVLVVPNEKNTVQSYNTGGGIVAPEGST